MNWSLKAYEAFIYSIQELSPQVKYSTLVLKRTGNSTAELIGELKFARNLTLSIYENLSFIYADPDFILVYSYEVRKNDSVQYLYDSQPHPNDPTLQSTHPHHKHNPPEIKHHRIPAPELSFISVSRIYHS